MHFNIIQDSIYQSNRPTSEAELICTTQSLTSWYIEPIDWMETGKVHKYHSLFDTWYGY